MSHGRRHDDAVVAETEALLEECARLVHGWLPVAAPTDLRDTLGLMTATVLAALPHAAGEDEQAALLTLGARAQDLAAEIQEQANTARRDLRGRVDEALARLRRLGSCGELADAVCEEAVRSCGFTRVLLSRVEQDTWRPWRFRAADAPAVEATMRALIDDVVMPLATTPVEARILERGRPAIVRDARHDTAPLTVALRSSSYVVAPITTAGRVIGLLHADHDDGSAVDEIDRDLLWTFAEGFGHIYERTALQERLRAQRERATATLRALDAAAAAVDDATIELARDPARRLGRAAAAPPPTASTNGPLEQVLTAREREVLDLMLRGHGNAAIAKALYITEGTSKTHVSRILRKLGAPNRAAVAGMLLGRN
jgi:DNA-binding CsgD family transcriptional regulator